MLTTTSITASIIGLIQCLIFSFLLLAKKNKQRSDWVLWSWFLLFIIHLSLISSVNEASKIHLLFAKTVGLLHGPFLLFYTRSVFNIPFSIKSCLHFIPFLGFLIGSLFMSSALNLFFEGFLVASKIVSLTSYAIYVIYWLSRKLISLKKTRADNFYIDTKWIKTIAFLLLGYSILRTLHFLGDILFGIHFSGFLDIAMYVVIVTFIGFYGLKFKVVYDSELPNTTNEDVSKTKYKTSPLKKKDRIEKKKKVDHFFESTDAFLDSDFSLGELSEQLDIPKHHLSQIINLDMGTTFYDLVNAKRVQYAIQQMSLGLDKHITLEGLGYEAGFKTKSAFYHHFKHFTGKTPGEYRSEISTD